jgi:cellobiose-specific phosphotransferase system component IIB
MSMFNFASGATAAHLLAAVSAANTAAATGSAVDLIDYDTPVAIVQSHGASTGTLDGKIQDSADGSTGWADVTGATFTQSTTTADVQVLALNPKSVKRYVRYVGTVVTGPQVVGVALVGVKKSV